MNEPVEELCRRASVASGFNLSIEQLSQAAYTPIDERTRLISKEFDIEACFFDQPKQVHNVPLELVVAPLDFKATPWTIAKAFHSFLSKEEIEAVVASASKIPVANSFGTALDIVFDFEHGASEADFDNISRKVQVWVHLGVDEKSQFLVYAEQLYFKPDERENAETAVIESLKQVIS